jgi:hypothetical protein
LNKKQQENLLKINFLKKFISKQSVPKKEECVTRVTRAETRENTEKEQENCNFLKKQEIFL